jgi:pimeloyl-ACP methyl ester carboxylesterase
MDGVRHVVRGADGVEIGLMSAGSGSPLLLVHGGVGQIKRWQPMWDHLSAQWRVTAMDRRGRGSSGHGRKYFIDDEFRDVASIAVALSEESGQPIDVFAHSYGATCTLGAASQAAPFRRIVLYEPPAKETVSPEFVDRLDALVVAGQSREGDGQLPDGDHRTDQRGGG